MINYKPNILQNIAPGFFKNQTTYPKKMDLETKKRVSYYFDDEIGLFTFNKGHPMRPLRMKVTDELIKVIFCLNFRFMIWIKK